MEEYLVPTRDAQDEFVEKRSRFIGYLFHTPTEEEAVARIKEMREKHWDATHNVYAYIIHKGPTRFSDDGEPGGTAGMPILDVIKNKKLYCTAVVVTRYFGGILLGAGGLVRAYTQGAAMALNATQVAVMHPTQRLLVDVPYPLLGRFEHFLKSAPVRVEDKAAAHALHEEMGCICFENRAMDLYFIHDPDGYWIEILDR